MLLALRAKGTIARIVRIISIGILFIVKQSIICIYLIFFSSVLYCCETQKKQSCCLSLSWKRADGFSDIAVNPKKILLTQTPQTSGCEVKLWCICDILIGTMNIVDNLILRSEGSSSLLHLYYIFITSMGVVKSERLTRLFGCKRSTVVFSKCIEWRWPCS